MSFGKDRKVRHSNPSAIHAYLQPFPLPRPLQLQRSLRQSTKLTVRADVAIRGRLRDAELGDEIEDDFLALAHGPLEQADLLWGQLVWAAAVLAPCLCRGDASPRTLDNQLALEFGVSIRRGPPCAGR